MSSTHRSTLLRAAAIAGALVLSLDLAAAPALAQPASAVPRWRTLSRATIDDARADSLVAQAETLQLAPGGASRWADAAKLYRRAAQLRGDDTAAVGNWRLAAWHYSAAGDDGQALAMMKRAAETATRVGDVERAIGSFLDAALIASDAGRTDQVGPMMERAQLLLESPLLPVNRRAALLQRIQREPMLAAALRE